MIVRRSLGRLVAAVAGLRGGWQPGRTNFALFVIQVSVTVQCLTRGIDYLRPDTDTSSLLSKVQDSAPLHVWAALFVAAAVVVIVGILGGWGRVIAAGHLLAMAAYASVGYGVLQVTGFGPGVRTPSGLLWTAVIHGALGFSIFAVVRRRDVTHELAGQELEG